jgi:hypothetical protein
MILISTHVSTTEMPPTPSTPLLSTTYHIQLKTKSNVTSNVWDMDPGGGGGGGSPKQINPDPGARPQKKPQTTYLHTRPSQPFVYTTPPNEEVFFTTHLNRMV